MLALVLALFPLRSAAQTEPFDASWYHPDQPYLKIAVVEDGLYRLTGASLSAAGVPVEGIDPTTFQLFENGREIPLYREGSGTTLQPEEALVFVGKRNRGDDEAWAYNEDPSLQSSTFYSLYTDTTTYWLTWNAAPGLRYAPRPLTSTLPPSTTARDTVHVEKDNEYFFGDLFFTGNPLYTRGEGYYWSRFSHSAGGAITRTFDVVLPRPVFDPALQAHVQVHFNAETNTRHRVILSLRLREGTGTTFVPVDTVEWNGTAFATLSASITQDRLPADGNLTVQITSTNDFDGTPVNRVLLDWIEVSYVRSLTADNDRLTMAVGAGGTYRATLSGFSDGPVLVLAPGEGVAHPLTATGGSVTLTDTPSGPTRYWAAGPNGFRTPLRLALDTPSDWAASGLTADYLILTTAALRPSAEAMAAYRQSLDGGGHEVRIVDVQDVFDQFDYGRPTPVAIRRFLRATRAWATPPAFLLIWGDALYPLRTRPRHAWEVPSFGHTASDGWYAMQLGGLNDYTEFMAIGRLPVRTNESGLLFVDKITNYESRPFEAWQKKSMFLVGGISAAEKTTLQSFSLNWSDLAATSPAALDTLHFFKNSDAPLDPTFLDSLQAAFAHGASWVTYFGHSAAQTWEIVTAPPREFNNAGRLPVVLSLGCFTGDFATGTGSDSDVLTFSEQLVLETLNGSIAHWGASASGTILASAQLSDEIHRGVFTDTLRTLGTIFREAKARYATTRFDPLAVKHLLQYGLIGDPATRLSLPTHPDLVLTASRLHVTPEAPIPADSALTVTVTARNYGLIPPDSVDLELVHTAPDGTVTPYARRLPPFGFEQSALFTIPLNDESPGEHHLRATLDPLDALAEESETNNTAERTQVVFATGLALVTPPTAGLVDTVTPTLRVSLADPDPVSVIFQVDTLATFATPLQEHRTDPSLLAASWQPAPLQDGTTYYWRARIDVPGQEDNWKTGLFTVDTALGQRGWLQQEDLFLQNERSPRLEHTGDRWAFKTYTLQVSASSSRNGGTELNNGQIVVNSEIFERTTLGFGVLILDGGTGVVKGHGAMPTYGNNFEDPAAAFEELKAVAALAMPGDYAIVRTRHKGNRDGETVIPDSVKAIFRDLGSIAIDTLTYQDLWIMFARVGDPDFTIEWVEPKGSGVFEMTQSIELPFHFTEGTVLSPPIGPAKTWKVLGWSADLPTATSEVRVDVLDGDGSTVLIADLVTPGEADLSGLDTRQHPFLRLRATLRDTTGRSTPQLTRWYVGFDAVPELALDPASLTLSADTLREGAPLTIRVTARNLADIPAETALLDYYLTDAANETVLVQTDTLRDLRDAATASLTLETLGRTGTNRLNLTLRQPDLHEAVVFNNLLIAPFVVERDGVPPTFEVRIDGEPYPNNPDPVVNLQDPALPFVPARPTIEILIRDDNDFLPLQGDTTIVTVTLDDRRIPFEALAGKRQDNEVLLRFQPDFSGSDSTHTLVVSVQDASGNKAEGSPYQVHFRTSSALRVEKVFPYPNPMNTFTVFAFRLIGPEASLIEDFRIRLYTLNGRLIREFDLIEEPGLTEAGGLRIGWNKVRWDGTDADGDRVATGVYLYKVFVRARDGDAGFNEATDVEKLVVIR